MGQIRVTSIVNAPRSKVFEKCKDLKQLPQLLKDSIDIELLQVPEKLENESSVSMKMTRFGLSLRVVLGVDQVVSGQSLSYHQVEGLFRSWQHTIQFEEHDSDSTRVVETIDYALPMGILGVLADDLYIRQDLIEILNQRWSRLNQSFLQQNPN